MIWLRSNERFNDIAELDPATGTFIVHSCSAESSKTPPVDGTFSILNDAFCAIYRIDGALRFRMGAADFELDDATIVQVDGLATSRRLVVVRNGHPMARLEYAVNKTEGFELDPTPFAEDEDFDFGLFVANVSQSAERKSVLLDGR